MSDHLGSTNGLADSTGSLTATTGYDAFGNATNSTFPTRYQFTGRENDPRTGLMHYRARQYDPKLGRFISEDPIGFGGSDINLYSYVYNRPNSFRDPSGNLPIVPIIIGGGVIILASASPVNAPGPNSPIYFPDNPLILNAAGGPLVGMACRFVFTRFASPFFGRLFGGVGDDIISQGNPQVPIPVTTRPTTFLGQANGPAIPVPAGSSQGPIINPGGMTTGFGYTGGSGGGNGLHPKVTSVRIMNPTQPRGPSPGYPNGYVNYMNQYGQSIHPYAGQTLSRKDWWWHIPMN